MNIRLLKGELLYNPGRGLQNYAVELLQTAVGAGGDTADYVRSVASLRVKAGNRGNYAA